ncbi:MAG: FmdB family zinc ribbon protein [Terracidiphilus sp.]
MPLYEYRCTQCGHRFEKIQSFSAEPETECPKCHGPLIRPLTAPALQFKGAGWYVNDYASKSSAPTSDAAPEAASTAASADGKKPASESAQGTPAGAPASKSAQAPAQVPAPSSTPASGSST